MANSLRDQLLKAGFVGKAKPADKSGNKSGKRSGKPRRASSRNKGGSGEPDLARAYALRARAEADERRRRKAEAEREAQARRERKRKLREVLDGAALNKPQAELARHFEFGGKIRRVYVDATQLEKLNAGELAVVQHGGRYLVVDAGTVAKVLAFAPECVALRVEPGSGGSGADDGVPDDLLW